MRAPADPAANALRELRGARRRHRLEELDWLDAAYHAYLAAVVGVAITLVLSSVVGGERVSAATVDDVTQRGPAVLAVVVALALAAGLRSGSRGGPLALEPAEVRYVLLAPVGRAVALRAPALRAVRFALFLGTVCGAIGGQLAVRRLGGAPLAWVGAGALFGALVAALAVGAALVASGRRLPRPAATAIAIAIVAVAVLDATEVVPGPFRAAGGIALWPLRFEPIDLAAIAVVVGVVVTGMASLGGVSLEAAERRTGLVAQLRFAVTLQDLRTVVVLRRQLALDLPRTRPWVRLAARPHARSTWVRDWRGLLRFPLARLVRLVSCGVIAGLAARGVWSGTQPLVLVAGLALYVAALDAVEPLAQEIDQDDRLDAWPRERGIVLVRHLPVAALVMVLVAAIGAAVAVALAPSMRAVEIAAIALVPAALGAGAGAAVSVVSGIPAPGKDGALMPPEVAGMKIALRTAWPVIVSVVGVLPVLVGFRAAETRGAPLAATATVAVVALVPVAVTAAWVRFREPAHAWWQGVLEQGQAARTEAARS